MPQPYLVPVNPTRSRIAHNSGICGSASTWYDLLLIIKVKEAIINAFILYSWINSNISSLIATGYHISYPVFPLRTFLCVPQNAYALQQQSKALFLQELLHQYQVRPAHRSVA